MRDTVILRLGNDWPDEIGWVLLGGAMADVPSHFAHGTLAEAATMCEARRVMVLVPGLQVLLTAVTVPTRSRQRIAEAVPYLLEEQVSVDVDSLHFAIGDYNSRGEINVAVVARTQMDDWLSRLQEFGIRPDGMIPDVLTLPYQSGHWTVMLDEGVVLVRTGMQSGFAVEEENTQAVLRMALAESSEDDRPQQLQVIQCAGDPDALLDEPEDDGEAPVFPEEVTASVIVRQPDRSSPVSTMDEDAALADVSRDDEVVGFDGGDGSLRPVSRSELVPEPRVCEPPEQLADLDIEMTCLSYPVSSLGLLAQVIEEHSAIDLLQGSYSRRERLGRMWRPWRTAAILLIAWITLQAGILAGKYVYLSGEEQRLRQQAEQIYRKAFPQAKNVVNPRVQMERKLKELASSGLGNDSFLRLLASLSQPLKQTAGLQLQRIAYSDGHVDLALTLGNLQDLDRLKGLLRAQKGISVSIQSASSRNNRVEARLRVAGRAS